MSNADDFGVGQTDEAEFLPTVNFDGSDSAMQILRRMQSFVLKHPVAAQAAFAGLVAEGRVFAQTTEGRSWRERLVASELLHRARLIFDLPGLSMLAGESPELLPSAYVDTVFTLASSLDPGRLFEPPADLERGDV